LNACTGCGACVIACHAENNVPVVGKAEIRLLCIGCIDRYFLKVFEGIMKEKIIFLVCLTSLSTFNEMEKQEIIKFLFSALCVNIVIMHHVRQFVQVAATSHSRQGQNHMAYNRCWYSLLLTTVLYRRFNWFLYNEKQ
jgi:molybdopterin-containing oxidoreductase family iron-sulfur binding subunit